MAVYSTPLGIIIFRDRAMLIELNIELIRLPQTVGGCARLGRVATCTGAVSPATATYTMPLAAMPMAAPPALQFD